MVPAKEGALERNASQRALQADVGERANGRLVYGLRLGFRLACLGSRVSSLELRV